LSKEFYFLESFFLNNLYSFSLVLSIVISSSFSSTHFSLSKIEIGFVESNLDKMIFIITIIGTDNNIQTTPHIEPHNQSDNNITSGLKFNLLHISLGSIIFQIKICIHIRIESKTNKTALNPNCIIANIPIIQTHIIEPTVGIKFNIKIENAQNKAKSTLNDIKVKYVKIPVKNEVIDLIIK